MRLERRVTLTAVARVMGVSHQRVSMIEAADLPPSRTAARYLDALDAATATR
jgi:hypothetical protein